MKQLFVISVVIALLLVPVISSIAEEEGAAAGDQAQPAEKGKAGKVKAPKVITVKGAVSKEDADGQAKFFLTAEKGNKVELPATIGEGDKAVNVADLVGANVIVTGQGKANKKSLTFTKIESIVKDESAVAATEGKKEKKKKKNKAE